MRIQIQDFKNLGSLSDFGTNNTKLQQKEVKSCPTWNIGKSTAFLETEDYLKAVKLGGGEVPHRRLYVLIIRIILQLLQILVMGHIRQPLLHEPNIYIKTPNPKSRLFLKIYQ
jgi:hypothetical protein